MDIDALSDFILVAKNGSFSEASRQSGRPKASLSRKVRDLETQIGVRLFDRGSKVTRLTQEGEILFSRVSQPLREINEIAENIKDISQIPSGVLKISVPTLFATTVMGKLAAEFSKKYTEIKLDISVDDREVDLINEGYDLVIRVNPKEDSTLVGKCFATEEILIVGNPDLAKKVLKGKATDVIPAIARKGQPTIDHWVTDDVNKKTLAIDIKLELPELLMIRDAALIGFGIAKLPRILVQDDLIAERLVQIAKAGVKPSQLWVLHGARRLASPKIKVFMDFVLDYF